MASKKPYRKTIKTSPKGYKSFTLDTFIVTDEDGTIRDDLQETVYNELVNMSNLMRKNEDAYYEQNFRQLITTLALANDDTKGKKNAALRAYIDDIPFPPKTQSYNFKEMLRYNIASKTDIYITRYKSEQLIKMMPDASPRQIRQAYIDTYDDNAPSVNEIKKYQAAVRNSGFIDGDPHSNGQLPLSATDGHYRKLSSDADMVHLSIALNVGRVTLHFKMPKNKKRYAGKVCMPTVRCVNGSLLFDFAVESPRPKKKSAGDVRGFVSVDAGEVHTASYCFVSYDGYYSQPFVESARVRELERQVADLFAEIELLRAKAELCEACGWFDKAAVLYDEAAVRRERVSRLKRQCNEVVACEIVRAAVVLDAGVAVEDLSWVPESHWSQADLQKRLVLLAADCGLPVVRVSAARTSVTCPYCGGEMRSVGGRLVECCDCGRRVDRDVVAPRNVGVRAVGFGDCVGFCQRLVSLGSRERRRECGVLARCNKLFPMTRSEDRVNSSVALEDLIDSFTT